MKPGPVRGVCSESGCGLPHFGRGLCRSHYEQGRAAGAFGNRCSIDGCARPVHSDRLCAAHTKRLRRHGNPLAGNARHHAPISERIAMGLAAHRGLFDCWDWQRGLNVAGYGSVAVGGGRTMLAHRAIYELLVGPVPNGMDLGHLCRNRRCVNPAHLEAVTRSENIRRAWPYRANWKGAA